MREWDDDLAADPIDWLGRQLADLDTLVERSQVDSSEIDPDDARQLRDAVPEILDVVRRMLEKVRAGELAKPTGRLRGESEAGARRAGWL